MSKRVLSALFSLFSLVSIIRGQVLTADGTPLIGVNVTFVHYPEHGYTITRKDGMCVLIHYQYFHTLLYKHCAFSKNVSSQQWFKTDVVHRVFTK